MSRHPFGRASVLCAGVALAMTACGLPSMPGADVLDISSPLEGGEKVAEEAVAVVVDSTLERTPLTVTGAPSDYRKAFNDSNHVQLEAGRALGIDPLTDSRSFWRIRRPLTRVATNRDFVVAQLTHSKPFLVPEAAAALHEIGRRFNDSLQAHGGGDYRIVVTSVLRTPDDVRRLRRVNRNAVEESVHQMATTIDIAHRRFEQGSDLSVLRRPEDLSAVLASVLAAMRNEGRLYVKYESKQACFHITVRR